MSLRLIPSLQVQTSLWCRAREKEQRLLLLTLPQGKAQHRTRREFLSLCLAVLSLTLHHTTGEYSHTSACSPSCPALSLEHIGAAYPPLF